MKKELFINTIKASTKAIKCDLVIKNITIIDVFNKDKFTDTVGIKDGFIVGIGDYEGTEIIDGTDKFICPGLMDAHCHIESSLVTPSEYYKGALINGITSVVADPHEIANVLGTEGIDFMINSSKNIPFDMYFMLPSCVPGTDFENSGATLEAKDLKKYYKNDRILGLAEVMNFPAVVNCHDSMIDKLYDCIENSKVIDGHGAGLSSMMTNTYRTANISTDHECINAKEALEKVRRGMYVLIREGTAAKNLNDLLPAVKENNSTRFCLCTDDKHIDDMLRNGSINSSIVKCIKQGLKPETAIQMATLNPSVLYKLNNKGAIAPGYVADFIILDDLDNFKINKVYKNGKLVVSDGKLLDSVCKENSSDFNIKNSIHLPTLKEDSFNIDITNKSILNVMEIIPNKLETNHLKIDITDDIKEKYKNHILFKQCVNKDLLKIAVIERHKNTGNIGLGILKGLKLNSGAVATTIAHDSHNLIIAGTNDKDMIFAANELEKMQGGIVIVQNETVLVSISLEIAGLMTNKNYIEAIKDIENLDKALNKVTSNLDFNLFLTLSFLSLPVIPDLKITDKGLFNVKEFKFIDVAE